MRKKARLALYQMELLHTELGLQLAEGGFFVIKLEALEAIVLRVAHARAALLQASPKHDGGFSVPGLAVEGGAKTGGRCFKVSALPQRVAEVEVIIGIGGLAFDGFFKGVQSLLLLS